MSNVRVQKFGSRKAFGEWLRNYQKENKLTSLDLAQLVGVSDSTIYYWRNGVTVPKNKGLLSLEQLTGKRLSVSHLRTHAASKPKVVKRKRKVKGKAEIQGKLELVGPPKPGSVIPAPSFAATITKPSPIDDALQKMLAPLSTEDKLQVLGYLATMLGKKVG